MNIWWVLSKLTDLTRGVYLYTNFKKNPCILYPVDGILCLVNLTNVYD